MHVISSRRRQMLATALVATPLVPMAANAVHPSHGADAEPWLSSASAQRARFYAGHVRLLAASAVLVAAALGLFYVLWETASLVPWIGAGLTALGTLGLTGLVSLDFVIWEMADLPADRPGMLALLEKITGSAAIPSLFCGFATGLVAGPAVLVIALFRAGAVPMWTATMIAGGLATALAGVTIQPLAITGPLVALVGLASVARSRLRAGHASPEAMSPPTRLRAESG